MAAPLRILGCVLTLIAVSTSWTSVVVMAVHIVLDDDHHADAADHHDDLHHAATVLHGHSHDAATPSHSHDATAALASSQAPAPSLTTHASFAASGSSAFGPEAVATGRLDPSPPQRVPIILRI